MTGFLREGKVYPLVFFGGATANLEWTPAVINVSVPKQHLCRHVPIETKVELLFLLPLIFFFPPRLLPLTSFLPATSSLSSSFPSSHLFPPFLCYVCLCSHALIEQIDIPLLSNLNIYMYHSSPVKLETVYLHSYPVELCLHGHPPTQKFITGLEWLVITYPML